MNRAGEAYARGFADGWADRDEYQRRRTRLWAERWLNGEHRNDEAPCPTCLAGWALLDDERPAVPA